MSDNTLIKKLAKVMSDVKYIQKRGKNKYHGYMYATEADVNEKVREELAKVNILMLPSVKATEIRETKTLKGNTEYIARVDMEFTFVDGDSGEERTILMSGEGQDNGDKAIYKAISGTQKYALMKTFMIPTGDDPEQDRICEDDIGKKETPTQPKTTSPATITPAQAKQMIAYGAGHDEIVKKALAGRGYTKSTDVKVSEFDGICSEIQSEAIDMGGGDGND